MSGEWPATVADRTRDRITATTRRVRAASTDTLALLGVALAAGVLVFAVAHHLFPYHSINHDEGVYLQQAAMLLEGKLWLEPPVPDAVRPWFFVRDGSRLYPKYSPVAPALFAPAVALGVPRAALALIAAGSVLLVGLLGRDAFDSRTGVLAAALVSTAPLFLLTSATFLAYAPTTFLNLLFAVAYVRALRNGSTRYAALAGIAVGLAFFSRPYTALLFGLPFVVHAVVSLALGWRRALRSTAGGRTDSALDRTVRLGIVAVLGTAFVGLTLGYNWLQTGDPLVFPYQAFAPEDGIGFGHREILNHERTYTPELALRANRRVLWQFVSRWGPLGAFGTALAVLGLATTFGGPLVRRLRGSDASAPSASGDADGSLPDATLRTLLAGLVVTVPVGNVAFWGNLNVLAAVDDPTDGLIASLGPFYHFDLLLPAAVFGAAGALAVADAIRGVARRVERPRAGRVLLAAVLVVSLPVAGFVEADALGPPVERNAEHRDDVAQIYEPFADSPPDDALVFVPTPYGDWLQHPFQWLRNDPSFDGERVYVLNRGPAGDAASLAAYSDRRPYRFTYRGEWPPDDDGVTPVLEPLRVREGERLVVETRMGVPIGTEAVSVRIAADDAAVNYGLEQVDGETETLRWVVGPNGSRPLADDLLRYSDESSVPVDGPTRVAVSVTFTQAGGATVTYRQELTVLGTDGGVRALWPPEERVCRLTTDCGTEGTYLPDGDYGTGVSLSSTIADGNATD